MLAHENVKQGAMGIMGTKVTSYQTKLTELCDRAKLGDQEAQRILKEEYSTKVYTYLELAVINRLMSEKNLTLEEALKRLKNGS